LWDEFEAVRYGVVMNYDVILPWMDRERKRNGDIGVAIRRVTCCIRVHKITTVLFSNFWTTRKMNVFQIPLISELILVSLCY